MSEVASWGVDRNGDGYADDLDRRLCLDLENGTAGREFWSLLLDTSALAGVHLAALPLPFVYPSTELPASEQARAVVITNIDDLRALTEGSLESAEGDTVRSSRSRCLTSLFTITGALADRDGDLVPDDADVRFDLPERLPTGLGAALGNLAARIGYESGGVTLPLTGPAGTTFIVRPGDGDPSLASTGDGWLASGNEDGLADLIDMIAARWPHVTAPETGGVASALGWLRRALAGDGPEPAPDDDVAWQLEWSAQWEIDRLWSAFIEQLLTKLDAGQPLNLTVLCSEPLEIRRNFSRRVSETLHARGFPSAKVEALCSFKSGLSWLREAVIPELAGQAVARIRIDYRRFPAGPPALDPPTRWLQELFPGNEILADELNLPLDAIEIVERDGPIFRAEAFDKSNETLGAWEFSPLHRTMPFVLAIPESGTVCVTTGGFIATQGDQRTELPVQTDLESFWAFWQAEVIPRVLAGIDELGGAYTAAQPFFSRLHCDVWLSEPNSRIGVREENDSAAEALHEDIYFNTLDAIEMYGEQQTGERTNAPGAVVPVVHVQPGVTPHARVSLWHAPKRAVLPYLDVRGRGVSLQAGEFVLDVVVDNGSEETLARLELLAMQLPSNTTTITANISVGSYTVALRLPLPGLIEPGRQPAGPPPMDVNIHGDAVIDWAAALAAFPEITAWIEVYSYEGRPLVAMALAAPATGRLCSPARSGALKPTCLIVARHHANEISSTNAAFQLAWLCATDPEWRALLDRLNIVILPYENPDGAALHAMLASDPATRNWKHHPARYNALGAEFSQAFFDPDTRFGESRVRPAIWRRWLPDVLVDNHGVPSHEWVQPFAGFGSPPRFRVSYWIPQALLYGIVGYVDDAAFPEHQQAAMALRDAVSSAVRDTDIGLLNNVIGHSYRFWGQERDPGRFPGEFHDGMLWHVHAMPSDPEGRGFAARFPKTTVLSWVTEVNDETAEGAHLERTARAHLLANRAMLDLMAGASVPAAPRLVHNEVGRVSLRVVRERPLRLGQE